MGLAGTSCHAPPRGRARVLVCVFRHPTRHRAAPPFPQLDHPRGGVGSSAVTLHIKSLCFEIVRTHLPRYHRHAHLRALRRPHHSDVSIGL